MFRVRGAGHPSASQLARWRCASAERLGAGLGAAAVLVVAGCLALPVAAGRAEGEGEARAAVWWAGGGQGEGRRAYKGKGSMRVLGCGGREDECRDGVMGQRVAGGADRGLSYCWARARSTHAARTRCSTHRFVRPQVAACPETKSNDAQQATCRYFLCT